MADPAMAPRGARTRVADAVHEMREPCRRACRERGVSLSMEADPDLFICTEIDTTRAIINLMMIYVEEAVPSADTIRLSVRRGLIDRPRDADPSEDEVLDFVLFRVDAGPGPVAPTRRIEKSLRDMAFGLDGDLGVSEDDGAALSLLMQIPAAPERAEVVDARRRAAVFHDDQRVRRTLVAALTHLGWSCDHGSAMVADYALPEDAAVAFADGWATERLRPLDPRVTVVELVARGEAPENEGPSLSIPFELGELEALLERALEGIQE